MNTAVAEDKTAPNAEAGVNVKPSHRQPGGVDLTPPSDRRTVGTVTVDDPIMSARDVNVYYGDKHAIKSVSLDVGRNQVVAMIGPSGCGKSTFLRCLNRMNDTIESARVTGRDHHGRRGYLRSAPGRGAATCACRHGVPEAQSIPQIDLRECRLRSAHSRARGRSRRIG